MPNTSYFSHPLSGIMPENCFWIKYLDEQEKFNFSHSNIISIYAKNGTMKTSFTKVFKKIQDNKEIEIKDEIFWNSTRFNITIDNRDITADDIFSIWSLDEKYQSESISSLLLDNNLQEKFNEVKNLKFKFLKSLKSYTWLSVPKDENELNESELENKFLKDFWIVNTSFLDALLDFEIRESNSLEVLYKDIFDNSKLETLIIGEDFKRNIDDFINRNKDVYGRYSYLHNGDFSYWKFQIVSDALTKNNFFLWDNKILLQWLEWEIDKDMLQSQVDELNNELLSTPEMKKINKALNESEKWKKLYDVLKSQIWILEELQNPELYRKKFWYEYLSTIKSDGENLDFEILKQKYSELKELITPDRLQETRWKEAVEKFNNRFDMPYKMNIGNLENAIFWDIPVVQFIFTDDAWNEFIKNKDEISKSLSQWEKRALYLLNIIFDIEKVKKDMEEDERLEKIVIVDDIADSFDYKNKYAIIEYLKEISEDKRFKMIILTHNFDFHRTVSSRLWIKRENRFNINNENGIIEIYQEAYQRNPWKHWKENLSNEKYIIALIPFLRNLIEYWNDSKVNTFPDIDNDYLFLTSLLHIKNETKNINFLSLKELFRYYFWFCNFDDSLNSLSIFDKIIEIADSIDYADTHLEDKMILSIAIRLIAEESMKKRIWDDWWFFSLWRNPTGKIFKKVKDEGLFDCDELRILESVNIMTPENIHLNSFMYEPILDMDIIELKNSYDKIKLL